MIFISNYKSILEWKLIEKLSGIPRRLSEIDRTFYHPVTQAYEPIEDEDG